MVVAAEGVLAGLLGKVGRHIRKVKGLTRAGCVAEEAAEWMRGEIVVTGNPSSVPMAYAVKVASSMDVGCVTGTIQVVRSARS
jgi:hypothetical protein